MIEYKNGALPSPPDDRDWRINRCMDMPAGGSLEEMLPKSFSISWTPKHKDQGKTSSCTAFALAGIFSCVWHQLFDDEVIDFSTGYLYGNRLETLYTGEGQYMRSAIKGATIHGDVRASVWDNNLEVPEAIEAFTLAYPLLKEYAHKLITGYVRIRTEREAKAYLYKYDLPLFISAPTNKIKTFGGSDGLHAMMCIGWKHTTITKKFICQNSWGTKHANPELDFDDFDEVWGIIPMEKKKFTDVDETRWSADAIQLAADDGIIAGFPDGTFAPEESLTREQIAVIWQRMKRYCDEHYVIK